MKKIVISLVFLSVTCTIMSAEIVAEYTKEELENITLIQNFYEYFENSPDPERLYEFMDETCEYIRNGTMIFFEDYKRRISFVRDGFDKIVCLPFEKITASDNRVHVFYKERFSYKDRRGELKKNVSASYKVDNGKIIECVACLIEEIS